MVSRHLSAKLHTCLTHQATLATMCIYTFTSANTCCDHPFSKCRDKSQPRSCVTWKMAFLAPQLLVAIQSARAKWDFAYHVVDVTVWNLENNPRAPLVGSINTATRQACKHKPSQCGTREVSSFPAFEFWQRLSTSCTHISSPRGFENVGVGIPPPVPQGMNSSITLMHSLLEPLSAPRED